MNGAEALVATAISQGIEVCFANPGTTEMPLVLALDSVPGLRASSACTRTSRLAQPTAMEEWRVDRPCACCIWDRVSQTA
jgi:thiamine pyrophosphate-dependent acetolactate synthase large subunit-like protein